MQANWCLFTSLSRKCSPAKVEKSAIIPNHWHRTVLHSLYDHISCQEDYYLHFMRQHITDHCLLHFTIRSAHQIRCQKINAAEFLAALITCETFSRFCVGCITKLSLDNVTAKAWLDSARCPRYPFDRCAQSTHLFMIKSTMKIKTLWVPSHMNKLADICSRKPFSRNSLGHIITGVKLMRVRPKYQNVTRFLWFVFNTLNLIS